MRSQVCGSCDDSTRDTKSGKPMNKDANITRPERVRCPMCAARIEGTKRCFIDWDADRCEFRVILAFHCWPCHYRFGEQLLKRLPAVIAATSSCSCGSTLSLGDYAIRKTEDDEVEFEAVYTCPACALRRRSIVSRVKRALSTLWQDSTKIELGPNGIKYEKQGKTTQ